MFLVTVVRVKTRSIVWVFVHVPRVCVSPFLFRRAVLTSSVFQEHSMKSQWVRFSLLSILALSVLTFCTSAFAQFEKGSVGGTVTDPSGAVVVGAEVSVTSSETGAVRSATSDATGGYSITALAPGAYELKISQKGFGD